METTEQATVHLGIRAPEDQVERLKGLAMRDERTVTYLVCRAIEQYLTRRSA